MKRNNIYKLSIIATLVVLFFGGCKKDTVTLKGRISHYGNSKADVECTGKVYIDGSTPRWNNGDELRVNENLVTISTTDGTTAAMEVPTAGTYKAVYPGSIAQPLVNGNVANLTLPRMQIYQEDDNQHQIVGTPMCAVSNNSTLNFKNMGALLAINLTNNTSHESITIDSVSVKSVAYSSTAETPVAATAMWGEAVADDISTAEPSYAFTAEPDAGENDSVTLACGINQSLGITLTNSSSGTQNKTVYIYVPAISSSANNLFSIRVFATDNGTHYTYLISQTGSYSGNIGRNQKADVPFSMTNTIEHEVTTNTVPEGALSGIFTVDGNGTQVYFSKGNLQYLHFGTHNIATGGTANGTWRFAENQWNYIGSSNVTNLNSTTEWIDLFGWGTSGYYHSPRNTTNVSNSYAAYMEGSINFAYYYDWGKYNAISNGGSTDAGLWRTLTSAEWDYLLGYSGNGRMFGEHTGAGYCYQKLQVNSIWGLLIYPDNFSQQTDYNSSSNLTNIPEGCAFLPMAGKRTVTTVSNVNSWGYYWSSTTAGTTTSATNTAKAVRLQQESTTGIKAIDDQEKYLGYSVRLVQEVSSASK